MCYNTSDLARQHLMLLMRPLFNGAAVSGFPAAPLLLLLLSLLSGSGLWTMLTCSLWQIIGARGTHAVFWIRRIQEQGMRET